jgi:hypothetical protein
MSLEFYPGTNCPEYPFTEMMMYGDLEIRVSMYVASKLGVMSLQDGAEEALLSEIRDILLALPDKTGHGNILSEHMRSSA